MMISLIYSALAALTFTYSVLGYYLYSMRNETGPRLKGRIARNSD